jgi:hypothetical protein
MLANIAETAGKVNTISGSSSLLAMLLWQRSTGSYPGCCWRTALLLAAEDTESALLGRFLATISHNLPASRNKWTKPF